MTHSESVDMGNLLRENKALRREIDSLRRSNEKWERDFLLIQNEVEKQQMYLKDYMVMEENWKQSVLVADEQHVRILKLELECEALSKQLGKVRRALQKEQVERQQELEEVRSRLESTQEELESVHWECHTVKEALNLVKQEKEDAEKELEEKERALQSCRRDIRQQETYIREVEFKWEQVQKEKERRDVSMKTEDRHEVRTPYTDRSVGKGGSQDYLDLIEESVEEVLRALVRWTRHAGPGQSKLLHIWDNATASTTDGILLPSQPPRYFTNNPIVNDILAYLGGIRHVAFCFVEEALGSSRVDPLRTDTDPLECPSPSKISPRTPGEWSEKNKDTSLGTRRSYVYEIERSELNRIRSGTFSQLSL